MKDKEVFLNIRISHELRHKLKKMALEKNTTIKEMLTNMISKFLES